MNHTIPLSVNFHLWKPCNLRCRFCYCTFDDDPALRSMRGGLDEVSAIRILDALRQASVEKITFVGGEPTLCPHLPALLRHSHALGLVTTLVTNGTRLPQVLDAAPDTLDWVGLSIDSADEAIQKALGRGRGDHVRRSIENTRCLHELGIRVKLNTVVTVLTWEEDMTELVRTVNPERWKVFQVLPITGQNDVRVGPLLISDEQFAAYVKRNALPDNGSIKMVSETNDAMTGSYAMIDPIGRFFGNQNGIYVYSKPILEVGPESAFAEVDFSKERFIERGGVYDWGRPLVPPTVSSS
jgi:radical S-adenosyl methionine domain-containing protein 2